MWLRDDRSANGVGSRSTTSITIIAAPGIEHLYRQVNLTQILGRLPGASNFTLLATDSHGVHWVYKPVRGERPLHDFAYQSLAAREILTYQVAAGLGWELVPPTYDCEGPLGFGSAQQFYIEDDRFDPVGLLDPEPSPRLWPVALLDIVTNNADRKIGHILQRQNGELFAIDHGLTFHPDDKLRTVLWGLAGKIPPAELLSAIGGLPAQLSGDLGNQIAQRLGEQELTAVWDRVNLLLSDPEHPFPPQHRTPIPWPVW